MALFSYANLEDVFLSNNIIGENVGVDVKVGEFIVVDTLEDTHTFNSSEENGNSNFYVLDNILYTNATLASGSYVVTVIVFNSSGDNISKEFEIIATDTNTAPTNFDISNTQVLEDEILGFVIADISAQDAQDDALQYYMLSGDLGVELVTISPSLIQLEVSSIGLNFEEKSQLDLIIGVSDGQGLSAFNTTIDVIDVNEELYFVNNNDFLLEEALWNDNQFIGVIDVDDYDTNQSFRSFTYSIVENYGTDEFFKIDQNGNLYVEDIYDSLNVDYDEYNNPDGADEEFTLAVEVSDGEFTISREVVVFVTNSNDLEPYNIFLTNEESILESHIQDQFGSVFSRLGSAVASLQGEDYDRGQELDDFIFEVVGVEYYPSIDDSSFFNISKVSSRASQLETAIEFNYEYRDTYYLNISIDDGANAKYYELFEFPIEDVNDNPTQITLQTLSISENNAIDMLFSNITVDDEDFNEEFTLSLIATGDDYFSLRDSRVDEFSLTHNIDEVVSKTDRYTNSNVYVTQTLNYEDFVYRATNPSTNLNVSDVFNGASISDVLVEVEFSTSRGSAFNTDTTLLDATVDDISNYLATLFNSTQVIDVYTISVVAPIESMYYDSTISISSLDDSSKTTSVVLSGQEPYVELSLLAIDSQGLNTTQAFNVSILDEGAEAPYDMTLSQTVFNETSKHCVSGDRFEHLCNVVSGDFSEAFFIANITTSDEDSDKFLVADEFTYSLDNSYGDSNEFTIIDNSLYSKKGIDFESTNGDNNYSIQLMVTDSDDLTYVEVFNLTVLNIHEEPEINISLENNSIISTFDITPILNSISITDNATTYSYAGVTQDILYSLFPLDDSDNLRNGVEYELSVIINDSVFDEQVLTYSFMPLDASLIEVNITSLSSNLTISDIEFTDSSNDPFDFKVVSYLNDSGSNNEVVPYGSFTLLGATLVEIDGLNMTLELDESGVINASNYSIMITNIDDFRVGNVNSQVSFYLTDYDNSKDYIIAHCTNYTGFTCNENYTNLSSSLRYDSTIREYEIVTTTDEFGIFIVLDEDKPQSSGGGSSGGGSSSDEEGEETAEDENAQEDDTSESEETTEDENAQEDDTSESEETTEDENAQEDNTSEGEESESNGGSSSGGGGGSSGGSSSSDSSNNFKIIVDSIETSQDITLEVDDELVLTYNNSNIVEIKVESVEENEEEEEVVILDVNGVESSNLEKSVVKIDELSKTRYEVQVSSINTNREKVTLTVIKKEEDVFSKQDGKGTLAVSDNEEKIIINNSITRSLASIRSTVNLEKPEVKPVIIEGASVDLELAKDFVAYYLYEIVIYLTALLIISLNGIRVLIVRWR